MHPQSPIPIESQPYTSFLEREWIDPHENRPFCEIIESQNSNKLPVVIAVPVHNPRPFHGAGLLAALKANKYATEAFDWFAMTELFGDRRFYMIGTTGASVSPKVRMYLNGCDPSNKRRVKYLYEVSKFHSGNERIAWLKYAAANGSSKAKVQLGLSCLEEKNLEKARVFLSQAANEGSLEARVLLINNFLVSTKTIFTWLTSPAARPKKLAEKITSQGLAPILEKAKKNHKAVFCAAIFLSYKGQTDQIISKIRQAAKEEDPHSQNLLGFLYATGEGVPEKSPRNAFRLFHAAAEKGYPPAQCNLALCYYHGIGVKKNYEKVLKWLQKGAEHQHPKSQYLLAAYYRKMSEENLGAAFQLFLSSAKGGYRKAQYEAGLCYENGAGTVKDLNEARKWVKKAAAQEYPPAVEHLKKIPLKKRGLLKSRSYSANSSLLSPRRSPASSPRSHKIL